MFANFRKAFKKPESVITITKEQMQLFMGEEPEVKCYVTHKIQVSTECSVSSGLHVVPIKRDGTCDKPVILVAQPI